MADRIERLEQLARELVGDGQEPNLYFVTDQGNVVTITTDFELAHKHWSALAHRSPRVECALEDRQRGVWASVEPEAEDGSKLIRLDDTPF